jgi:hypothetical protein
MRRLSMRRVESFLREEQRNLPSFESVLALARNEVAAKNSTTAPMAAAAMPGECSSSPSSPPTSCLLPFTACTVCFCLQAPRSKPTYMLKRKGGKWSAFFFLPLFLYATALFLSSPPSRGCQRHRVQEVEVRITDTKRSKYFVLLASHTHTKKRTEGVFHWLLLLFRVLAQVVSFWQKDYPIKSSDKGGENVLKQERGT